MAKKSKKDKWFTPVRGSYLPNNWKGWLTYIPFTAFLFFSGWYDWHHNDNHGMAVLIISADWVAGVVVMTWVAKRTS